MKDKYKFPIVFTSVSIENSNLIKFDEILEILKALAKKYPELEIDSDLDPDKAVYRSVEQTKLAALYSLHSVLFRIHIGNVGEYSYPILAGASRAELFELTQKILQDMQAGREKELAVNYDDLRKIDEQIAAERKEKKSGKGKPHSSILKY